MAFKIFYRGPRSDDSDPTMAGAYLDFLFSDQASAEAKRDSLLAMGDVVVECYVEEVSG